MASKKQVGIVAAVFVLFMCVSAYSAWTEPIHLSELNGPEYAASRPRVSSDGSIIYFVRHKSSTDKYYLWEAQKNEETGLYGQERVVSEIGRLGGQNIFGVWMSEDSNRLYHCWDDPDIPGDWEWGRSMSMATRDAPDRPWVQIQHYPELQNNRALSRVSLTSDELNVMWTSRNEVGAVDMIFTASRSSVDDSFSDIRPVTELDEIGAARPYMSADGLSVYFSIVNDNGINNLWKGSRDSLDAPFDEFKRLSDVINLDGIHSYSPCITPDGSMLFFNRHNPSMPAGNGGIYVSYWVDTPLEKAIENIRKAIAMKKMAIRKINASIAPETKAIRALEEMLKNPDLAAWKKRDTMKSKMILKQGIKKQIMARKEMYAKIEILKLSIELLLREKPADNNGNGRRPRTPIQFSRPRPTVGPKSR